MTEKDFRAMHSELIGYYQLIEMRLKGICAAFITDNREDWHQKLGDYRCNPFGLLVYKITEIQNREHISVLEQEDLAALDSLRETRNYWVHQCFGGDEPICFSRQGELKRPIYAQRLKADLRDAIEWDQKLTDISCRLLSPGDNLNKA